MTTLTMTTRTTRTRSLAAALTVAALIASMAGAKTARAWDQQATDDQMSTELSYRAAHGLVSRHQQSGPYASARSDAQDVGTGVAVSARDFQLEGR